MRNFILYHSNCADGFSAAWVVHRHLSKSKLNQIFLLPGIYTKPWGKGNLRTGDKLFIVDFSIEPEEVQELYEQGIEITWLDHHVSAFEKYQKADVLKFFHAFQFDDKRSGATIAWDFFNPDIPRPFLLNYVEDRDLWKFKLPHSQAMAQLTFSYEYKLEVWDKIMNVEGGGSAELQLVAQGEALLRKHMKDIKELLPNAFVIRIDDQECWALNVPYMMASDACDMMLKDSHWNMAATFYTDKKDMIFSLRSKTDSDCDVSKIAAAFGGGGHVHAAGFRFPLRNIEWAMERMCIMSALKNQEN